MTTNRPIDPALLRGLTMPRISRRAALRGAGLVGASAFLAACGVQGTNDSGGQAPQASGFWADKTNIALRENLVAHYMRMLARPAVQRVLREEGYNTAALGKFGTPKIGLTGERA